MTAAPRFLGLLRKAWPRQVADEVMQEEDKDLTHLTAQELAARLLPSRGA